MPTHANPSHRVPLFVPYPFRPFWQPNIRSSPSALDQDTRLERLSQKLDTAEKKIDEYLRLIASLYAELKQHQDIICHPCKEKIFRASLATAPPSTPEFSQSASQPAAASENLSEPISSYTEQISATSFQATNAPSSAEAPHDQSSPTSQSACMHPPADHGNGNINGLIFGPNNLRSTSASPPTTTVAVSHSPNADSEPSQLAVPSSSTSEDASAGPTQPEWSVEYNPEIKQTLSVHVANTLTFKAAVHCTKFNHDGTYLAVGLENGETHIHNMTTGSNSILVERPATVFYTENAKTPSAIWAVRFSPDNKYIATAGSNGQINIWEISRRRIRASFKHKNLVRSLDFSPDGRFLISASFDKSVYMWRIRDGSIRASWHESHDFMSVAFSPDGRYAAAGNEDGILRIWDTRTGQLVAKWAVTDRGNWILKSVIFTPDGKGVASGHHILRCWDVSSLTGGPSGRHMIQDDSTSEMNQIWKFEGHKGVITAVSFSFDNRWVISSSVDKNLCILDARTGSWVCTLKGHMGRIWGADSSPTGHYIVSGDLDNQVRLWRYDMLE